jgi:hypothetical protein
MEKPCHIQSQWNTNLLDSRVMKLTVVIANQDFGTLLETNKGFVPCVLRNGMRLMRKDANWTLPETLRQSGQLSRFESRKRGLVGFLDLLHCNCIMIPHHFVFQLAGFVLARPKKRLFSELWGHNHTFTIKHLRFVFRHLLWLNISPPLIVIESYRSLP